jgi:fused signal recognition particle receptor
MPEEGSNRRYSPENPSPAMQDFAQYIRDHGYPDFEDWHAAATAHFHKQWQPQHAARVREESKERNAEREKEREAKAEKREQDRKERDAKKKADEEAKEKRRQEREDAKAAKAEADAESGADGDDSTSDGETRKPRGRLRTRDEGEPVAAGQSAGSF